ncbi:MAG: tRNA dihydrouridine synthase DusB [Eubacterium sp.]|jgi:tRNA-dihydrouridine synthase B
MGKEFQNIGNVVPKSPFFLAPMAGFSDAAYRSICAEYGAGIVYSEMVSAKGLCYSNKNTASLLEIGECSAPTAFQIFGSDPGFMAEAAEILEPYGNAILDINMGCPVPKVVKNGDGSALLRDPELIYKIVKAVVGATSKPVTVKIRAGIEGAAPDAAVQAAQAAAAAGGSAVAVHGRTREQYYSGEVSLEAIAAVKKAVSIPVIGNGDVRCFDDAERMFRETGCDFIMVGRAALGAPWIFRELNAGLDGTEAPELPTLAERCETAIRQYRAEEELKGERVAVREMRKIIPRYFKGMKGGAALRRQINTAGSGSELIALIMSLQDKS